MLQGFEQLGVTFDRESGGQKIGDCPLCEGGGKFFVNKTTFLWDCKKCARKGNYEGFLAEIVNTNAKDGADADLMRLAKDRGISIYTLKRWKVGYDGTQYTYPEYTRIKNGERRVSNVRRFEIGQKPRSVSGGHLGLLEVTDWPHQLDGMPDTDKGIVWVCEGEWDAMAWSETIRLQKREGIDTVVGVSGAANFPQKLVELFRGRNVVLLFDNDEAGQRGSARAWALLSGVARSLKRLEWSADLPVGFDIRDLYKREKSKGALSFVLKGLTESPMNATGTPAAAADTGPKLDGPGLTPATVLKEYRKWMLIESPDVLDVMFGSVFANRMTADPLWLFLVAPPGGSKSEYLMTLTDAPLVYCVTSITPHALISGANFAGTADPSMLPRLMGKTLIVKDFTTILTMNMTSRDEIFGILRDAYDGKIDKEFGNGVRRKYEGKFGIIAGVTPAIDSGVTVSSVLGERFLKYRIHPRGKVTVGSDIILRAIKNIGKETAMRSNLREIAAKVMNRKVTEGQYPKISDEMAERIMGLAQWVAVMRGCVSRERYTGQINFKPTSEVGTRLAKQLATFGMGLGIYHSAKTLGEHEYRIVAQVAKDTAPDRIEEIVKQLYLHHGQEYASTHEISVRSKFPDDTVRILLQDLELLHIVIRHKEERGQWRLTDAMHALMKRLRLYEHEKAWKVAKEEKE